MLHFYIYKWFINNDKIYVPTTTRANFVSSFPAEDIKILDIKKNNHAYKLPAVATRAYIQAEQSSICRDRKYNLRLNLGRTR